MMKLKAPPIERRWAVCPYCNRNAVLHDDTANCNGIWHKCKSCGAEFEIRIRDGKQANTALREPKGG